jgi:hypothetical protein
VKTVEVQMWRALKSLRKDLAPIVNTTALLACTLVSL